MDIRSERDLETLRKGALLLESEVHRLLRLLEDKSAEVDTLRGANGSFQESLKLLESLRDKAEGIISSKNAPLKPRKSPDKEPLPPLEEVQRVFQLDEADRVCPQCGQILQPLEGQFESSSMIDVVEVSYQLVHVQRQKYVCSCQSVVETAPGPERTIAGSAYSLDFGIKIAADKYLDHLPLARQSRVARRNGLDVSRQTLWDQIYALHHVLKPTYEAIRNQIRAQPVIGLDQTGWPNLEQKKAKVWQMWCLTSDKYIYHDICGDKSVETFYKVVGPYEGIIVCDDLKTHQAAARDGPGTYKLAACWAHIYRRFREAGENFSAAQVALKHIKRLYEIDDEAEDLELRLKMRQNASKAELNAFYKWLTQAAPIKGTPLATAVRHTLSLWPRLTLFVEDARIWLDNNASERAIRGPVLGRRNHFGSKSKAGTQVASIYYSLFETAKLWDVSPTQYLREAVIRGRRGEVFLPEHFLAESS